MPSFLIHAARATVRRTRRGLYAGKTVRSGNNVSEDGGNRTRRVWKPNAQHKALYSEALERMVRLRVTTAAMRNIDRVGGLDEYLLSTPERELDSDVGLQLRQHIQAALRMRAVAAVPDAVAASPAGPEPPLGAQEAESANAGPSSADGNDNESNTLPSTSNSRERDDAPVALWALGTVAVGRSRLVMLPEHQVPRWDGTLRTVPQRSLRKPKWLLRN